MVVKWLCDCQMFCRSRCANGNNVSLKKGVTTVYISLSLCLIKNYKNIMKKF